MAEEVTDTDFDAKVIESDLPVLVDFWAEWCQPCRMLAPTIDEIAEEYSGRARVFKMDTDSNREIAMKYGVRALPTVVFFKDGEVKDQLVGFNSKEKFTAALDGLL